MLTIGNADFERRRATAAAAAEWIARAFRRLDQLKCRYGKIKSLNARLGFFR